MAKSKYETHVKPKLQLVEGWARDGLTDEQIAHNLGVAYSTFREYKKKYSALSAALKKGKEIVDYEVENALLKRALGYKYDEVTIEEFDDGSVKTKTVTKEALKKGKEIVDYEVENALLKRALGYKYDEVTIEEFDDGSVKTKTVTKEVIPDTTAQIFWLKNRRPDKWRDKQMIEADVKTEVNPFKDLTTEELRKLIDDD